MDTTLSNAMIAAPNPLSVLGGSDERFSDSLGAMRAELAPVGLVEELMVDRIVLAASRLRAAICCDPEAESAADLIAGAEQSFDRALAALNASRANRTESWGRASTTSSKANDLPCPLPMPVPAATSSAQPALNADSDTASEDGYWRDRLTFDEQVSEESPVVRGTWVTAGQVISMIVDGMTWDDILRHYPELTERDIRACVCYTVEQDGPINF
jgi:uncharacterized protein (DUF433 family)